jgi:hypothetical protein
MYIKSKILFVIVSILIILSDIWALWTVQDCIIVAEVTPTVPLVCGFLVLTLVVIQQSISVLHGIEKGLKQEDQLPEFICPDCDAPVHLFNRRGVFADWSCRKCGAFGMISIHSKDGKDRRS